MKLKNRTALITGAGRGIGKQIALAFAKEGANLIITARTTEQLQSVQGQVRKMDLDCYMISADLFERKSVDVLSDFIKQNSLKVDILVNNAGQGSSIPPKPVVEFDDKFWDSMIFLNLTIPYLLCKMVLPGMIERKFGRIINIASIAGKRGLIYGSAYSASKHGLLGLTRSLALEVVKDNIAVNAICPGPVRTANNEPRLLYDAKRFNLSPEQLEATLTPLGRRLLAEEIAPLAVYLATLEEPIVTGQAFNISGGSMMS